MFLFLLPYMMFR
uniref:Uncharacterized protein n=1 Tax=Leersia perrieri TaxID=77586 RepID=A0A0D9WUU2_9ORYZ